MIAPWWIVALLCLSPAAAPEPRSFLSHCDLGKKPARVWQLPNRLHEISGIGFTSDGVLLAHDDERGRLYSLDWRREVIVREQDLIGLPHDDFEAIDAGGSRVLLLSSTGILYTTAWDSTPSLRFVRRDTGLGRFCEFEGLGRDPSSEVLLLGCKKQFQSMGRGVVLFRWSLRGDSLARPAQIVIPVSALPPRFAKQGFPVSGIDRDPVSGHMLLLSSHAHAVLEMTATGSVVEVSDFSPKWHPQAEGIAVGPTGELLLSDEGGNSRATLSVYRCAADSLPDGDVR